MAFTDKGILQIGGRRGGSFGFQDGRETWCAFCGAVRGAAPLLDRLTDQRMLEEHGEMTDQAA